MTGFEFMLQLQNLGISREVLNELVIIVESEGFEGFEHIQYTPEHKSYGSHPMNNNLCDKSIVVGSQTAYSVVNSVIYSSRSYEIGFHLDTAPVNSGPYNEVKSKTKIPKFDIAGNYIILETVTFIDTKGDTNMKKRLYFYDGVNQGM